MEMKLWQDQKKNVAEKQRWNKQQNQVYIVKQIILQEIKKIFFVPN